MTFLRDGQGELFAPLAIYPESIVLGRSDQLLVSTEGDDDTMPLADPEIMHFEPAGQQIGSLPVPGKFPYSVDDGNHVRDNLGFESLTITPNGKFLFAATENALINDGPISMLGNGSPARFLQYLLPRSKALREFIYCVDPIPQAPIPADEFADHGLVEIDALDNVGTFLTMERSFAVGVGNTIMLFEATTRGAANLAGKTALHLDGCPQRKFRTMHKELLVNLEADLGVVPDNVEAMTFGPTLADGRRLLILVSDNNFNESQTTQFIALAVELVRDNGK